MGGKPKLLFLVAEDWYFCSHRLPLAVAALEAGYEVVVATRISDCEPLIQGVGIRVIPLNRLRRSSLNPFSELLALFELYSVYRAEKPSIVHHVALKPVVYGSLIARIIGIPARVNALGGLGFVFSSTKPLAAMLKPLLVHLFRLLFNDTRSRLILQNLDDLTVVTERAGVERKHIHLIRSAGVDLNQYSARSIPDGVPVAIFASRMLWDKGVGEFVQAARILKTQGLVARFILVGDPDTENPSSVPKEQLLEWESSGLVEWWGFRSDMPEVLSCASVVCLPSYYGEGIPKVLIEAMACARPIVTTDMPGCRDLVPKGKNGVLVEPRDSDSLAAALKLLLGNRSECWQMGVEGRKIVEEEYALPRVLAETLAVYRELTRE